MIDPSELGAEATALGIALGVLHSTPSGVSLRSDFFSSPAAHVGKILSDPAQRDGLLTALDALLPTATPAALNGTGRSYHPILAPGKGQLYVTVTRASSASDARIDVGLAAEAQAAGGGPRVTAEVPLVAAQGSQLTVSAATKDTPVLLELHVPVAAVSAELVVSVRLVAPPDASDSRIVVGLRRTDSAGGQLPPIEFDPLAPPAGISKLVTALLDTIFATVDPAAPPELLTVARVLPGVLGLVDDLPGFPYDQMSPDAGRAVRGWLGQLAVTALADGSNALAVWLDQVGQLLGADPATSFSVPTEADPVVIALVAPAGAALPGVDITVGVRTAADTGTQVLVVAARVHVAASGVDAALSADATLLAVPLSGTAPSTVLEAVDVVVRAPAGTGPLVSAAGVTVAGLRAGVRYADARVVPLVELTGVELPDGRSFASLDLTDTHTIGTVADDVVRGTLTKGLGSAGDLVEALLVLLGLRASGPAIDLQRFVSAPTAELARYYRSLLATTGGWHDVLDAVWRLLGGPSGATVAIEGSGTRADPWRAPLTQFTAPAGAKPALSLAAWNDSAAGDSTIRVRLALRADVASASGATPAWSVAATSQLMGFDLPASGAAAVSWLGRQAVDVAVTGLPEAVAGGVAVAADGVRAALEWTPGSPLSASAEIDGVTVSAVDGSGATGTTVALGTLRLPFAADAGDPALGLGADADQLWAATRLLIGRAASSWGGAAGAVVAAVLGLGGAEQLGLPADLPPLPLPTPGDLRSLLAGPAEALRGLLATLVDAEEGLAADGAPLIDALRRPLQAFLTDTLPALVGLVPDPDVPPGGTGNWADPWTVPLQPAGDSPVELLGWLEPDGPPVDWADPLLAVLDEGVADAAALVDAIVTLAPFLGEVGQVIDRADAGAAIAPLTELNVAFDDADGIVDRAAAQPDAPGWSLGVSTVPAPHHLLPRHPIAIAQVLEQVATLTDGSTDDGWAVLLVAPDIAGDDCWDSLLDTAGVTDAQVVDLRQPGISPDRVDLGGVVAAAYYVVHPADDGSATLAKATANLARVADRVTALKPAAKLLLVAHSYAGLVAEAWVAANPSRALGLVTIGAPLAAVTVPGSGDDAAAEGIRLVKQLAPDGLPHAWAVDAVLDHLQGALDGGYPVAAFARGGDTRPDLGGVPAVAVAGVLPQDLVSALADSIATTARAMPGEQAGVSHLGYGVRVGLGLPDPVDGDPAVDALLRLDVARVPLVVGADDPPHPVRELVVTVRLGDGTDWLLQPTAATSGPAAGAVTRVMAAELTVIVAPGSGGSDGIGRLSGAGIRLSDVALDGVTAPAVDIGDPLFPALFARLVTHLDTTARPGGRLAAVLGVLRALGIVVDGTGGATVSADAMSAMYADPVGYLGPRLPALLDSADGLGGLLADPGTAAGRGPWRSAPSSLPVEVVVESDPWRVTVRTTGEGLVTSADGRVTATWSLDLADLTATVRTDVTVFGLGLTRDPSTGAVSVRGGWLDSPVTLVPADPQALRAALLPLVPRLLVDAVLTAALEALTGGTARLGSLSLLVTDPARWLAAAFGDGTLPGADAINRLLAAVASAAGLETDATRPLVLPGGIVAAAAAGAGGDGLALSLTLPPQAFSTGGPTVGIDIGLAVDQARHVTPSGQLTVDVPLPSTSGWQSVGLRFGADPAGLALAVGVTDRSQPTPVTSTLTLLPTVTGLADFLAAAATRLLPEALDALVGAMPAGPGLDAALAVAEALHVYDSTKAPNGFVGCQGQLATLVDDVEHGNLSALVADAAGAAEALLRLLLGAAAVPAPATPTSIGVAFSGVLGGTVAVGVDIGHVPPAVRVEVSGVDVGPVTASVAASYVAPTVTADVTVDTTIDTGKGVTLRPRLHAWLTGGGLAVELVPLPDTDAAFVVALAPTPAAPTAAQLVELAEAWVVPLAATLLLQSVAPWLDNPLWSGAGKTGKQLLVDAGVANATLAVKAVPLPDPPTLLLDALKGLAGAQIPLPGGLTASVAIDGSYVGLRASGEVDIPAGDFDVKLRLGAPSSLGAPWGDDGAGPALFLLDETDPAHPKPMALLRLGGFGAAVTKSGDAPLVDTSGFRLGGAAAYVAGDIPLFGASAFARPAQFDGAVELEQLGLPISPSGDAGNPIASSLLRSGGSGDTAPANPPLDLIVYGGSRGWGITFDGKPQARLDVHRTFGPLHIDDVLIAYDGTATTPGRFVVGVDGGVSVSGLDVEVDQLSLAIPLRHPAEPSQWAIDLAGLAVSYHNSAVSIAGGLIKRAAASGGIEYDGALTVSVAGRGLSAIGSYAQPGTGTDRYTSLFVFVVVSAPLGGPPYLFVTGLAGGAGYNRRLLVPSDPTSVPAFPLVAAMDGNSGGSPMDALEAISKDIPPSRGSYWIAAGIKFSTFELLHTTALAYASLDRGLEVGLLGLMRMALPTEQFAIVSVELALAAKYSTVDQVLSIRAALTRNSWLISEDCQLTGGFAFVTWFAKPEALLTIGGYGPLYKPRPYYPSVDQIGFNWAVGGGIVVKGGAYFVLAPDALAFGGRLEAAYDVDPIRVWFTAYLDVLLAWDPFHYHADAGVSIGATFHFDICFFACVTISVTVSLGASVELDGPPLHAVVTVDLDIASVTVEFGTSQPPPPLPWAQFSTKYLSGGDAGKPATATTVAAGLRTVDHLPSGDGSAAWPAHPDGTSPTTAWPVSPEFAVRVVTRMPSMSYRVGSVTKAASFAVPSHVDVVPAGSSLPPVKGTLTISIEQDQGGSWTAVPDATLAKLVATDASTGFPVATWEGGGHDGSGPAMVLALGSVQLAAPLTFAETTGTLGDTSIPFAVLVHDANPRHLPLAGLTPAAQPHRMAPARVAAPEPAARPARPAPILETVVPPASAAAAAAAVTAAIRHPKLSPAAGRAAHAAHAAHDDADQVALGAAHVWRVDKHAAAVDVALRGGAAARVTALSAAGAPLHDRTGAPADVGGTMPTGTATVVVSSLDGDAAATPAGWQATGELLQVGPTTLLGNRCVVLTAHPLVAPRGLRAQGPHVRVPASRLTVTMPAVMTVFGDDVAVDVVVVQADRRDPAAPGLGDLAVTVDGGRLGPAEVVRTGARANLVFHVEERTGPLRVSVASVADWWLAGVVGLTGSADDWHAELRADPHARLLTAARSTARSTARTAGRRAPQALQVRLAHREEEEERS